MKKALFTLAIIFTVSLSSISCTTDSYDKDMDQSAPHIESTTTDSTDPIVIPKRD